MKTLHPRIHAGILADRRKQEHIDTLDELDVEAFDLVVVNLYPSLRQLLQVPVRTPSLRRSILVALRWFALRRRTTTLWPLVGPRRLRAHR